MAANHELIFLKPIFHEKIWGGRKLDTDWGYSIPDGPIGECWAISPPARRLPDRRRRL